jgi:hypothetical protein
VTNNTKEYAFVLDCKGKRLSPTNTNNAWRLIRKKAAKLVSKYPMVIQLKKEVETEETEKSEFVVGIDDGAKYVGISIVQKCKSGNKVILKGTIEHRNDVKNLMDTRRGYRKYHRYHKRYRKARFNNRASSRRKERLPPSIKQKRDAVIRVLNRLNKYIDISEYYLEDVMIDIRSITDGYKPYKWQYQKPNRLDENIRKAVILRDKNKCMECGKFNCRLEVHHIVPRKLKGSSTIGNLISLCSSCHNKTEGKEETFISKYQKLINGKNTRLDYAQHVMQGKEYLRKRLSLLGKLHLTNGGDTANRRIDWNIDKSHSNDAVVITGLKVNSKDCNIKDWVVKPMRRQSKAKTDNVLGIKHRDLVSYTYKNGEKHTGYVTALYPKLNALNFQSRTKHCKKVNAKKCNLLWKYNKIYWL